MKTLFLFFVLLPSDMQTSCTIVKKNAEEIKLSSMVIHQSTTSTSFDQLIIIVNGEKQTILLNELKRINLQESLGKKKGITTWRALVVKKNNQKMEVKLDLIKITGLDAAGEKVTFMSGSIDKILF